MCFVEHVELTMSASRGFALTVMGFFKFYFYFYGGYFLAATSEE